MTDHEKVLEIIRLKDQVPIEVDPRKTALLIIDVQRYFVSPSYPFVQLIEKLVPGAAADYCQRVSSEVIPNIQHLQELFRTLKLPIIYTGTGTSTGDGRDLAVWLQDFDGLSQHLLGTRVWPSVDDPSWQIDDGVAPAAGEPVLKKTTADPMNSTMLDRTLRDMNVEDVVVTGLTTDVCVSATARGAADRGYRTIVVEDACTALSEEMHRASLQIISLAFGRVCTAEQVTTMVSERPTPMEVGAS
jgi:nicotinamidase-related amidase